MHIYSRKAFIQCFYLFNVFNEVSSLVSAYRITASVSKLISHTKQILPIFKYFQNGIHFHNMNTVLTEISFSFQSMMIAWKSLHAQNALFKYYFKPCWTMLKGFKNDMQQPYKIYFPSFIFIDIILITIHTSQDT